MIILIGVVPSFRSSQSLLSRPASRLAKRPGSAKGNPPPNRRPRPIFPRGAHPAHLAGPRSDRVGCPGRPAPYNGCFPASDRVPDRNNVAAGGNEQISRDFAGGATIRGDIINVTSCWCNTTLARGRLVRVGTNRAGNPGAATTVTRRLQQPSSSHSNHVSLEISSAAQGAGPAPGGGVTVARAARGGVGS